jgi:hypothetical protein
VPTAVTRVTAVDIALGELLVADPPEAWRGAGFTVDDRGVCVVGSVQLRLVGRAEGTGIVGWTLRGLPSGLTAVDAIPTAASDTAPVEPPAHENGVQYVDHVVVLTPDLGRTTAALAELGLEPRRERDGELGGRAVRQVFYRLGEVILEVVGTDSGPGPAQLWGITFTVADIDATAAALGDAAGRVKDAVQPGRRIMTLRRSAAISVPTAFISPHVRSS